ncbi:hypothetical protein WA158_001317 [Blastocystis sp. Blastoise]
MRAILKPLTGVRVFQKNLLRCTTKTNSVLLRSFSTPSDNSNESNLFNPTPDHFALRNLMQDFVKNEVEPQALEYNKKEKFNMDLFRKCGELGLLGITVDEQYGGAGLDATASCIVHEELSMSDPAFCLSYLAHSILFTNNLYINGSSQQKFDYLPLACSGDLIGGIAMTEPEGGTDLANMHTVANKVSDGYILNGRKIFITNAAVGPNKIGDAFLVYAKVNGKISLFLVDKSLPGFSLGQVFHDKLGMRASLTGELVLEDVHVPIDHLVGEEGKATLCMMRNLEMERLTLAAMSVGIAHRCLDIMIQYSKEREAFGQPINRFGQIQHMIASSYSQYMAGKTYLYNTANNMNLYSGGHRTDTDGVKLYCGRMAKIIADNAIQVLGGYGYMGDQVVERLWRDSKLLEIGGGTNEAHEKNMTKDICKYPLLL